MADNTNKTTATRRIKLPWTEAEIAEAQQFSPALAAKMRKDCDDTIAARDGKNARKRVRREKVKLLVERAKAAGLDKDL